LARDPKKTAAEPEFDARLIRDLALLLEETGLSEIEIEREGRRIRVARQVTVQAVAAPAAAALPVAAPMPAATAPPELAPSHGDAAKHPGAVTSPMVGTAFLAADPDAQPYVKVGDSVAKGQTLLIIEAMKTMNPIPAPRAGKIVQVLISNGAPVEYGQPLVIIE